MLLSHFILVPPQRRKFQKLKKSASFQHMTGSISIRQSYRVDHEWGFVLLGCWKADYVQLAEERRTICGKSHCCSQTVRPKAWGQSQPVILLSDTDTMNHRDYELQITLTVDGTLHHKSAGRKPCHRRSELDMKTMPALHCGAILMYLAFMWHK